MEASGNEIHQGQFFIADLEPRWIHARVQLRLDEQALLRGRVRAQSHDHFVAHQGTAPPVLGEVREHPLRNFVPLPRPRGKVTHLDGHLQLGGQFMERHFPQATPAPITATAIGGDQQLSGLLRPWAAHFPPPATNRFGSESGRVMINPHTDPPLIFGNVVHPLGERFAQGLIHEVVDADFLWFTLRLPFSPSVLKIAHQFFLFRIHRDHRLPAFLERLNHRLAMLELRVAVGMGASLPRFAVALQTVACGM